jgi:hypothetical protein
MKNAILLAFENTGSYSALPVLCHANPAGFSDVWKICEAVPVAANAICRVGLIDGRREGIGPPLSAQRRADCHQ